MKGSVGNCRRERGKSTDEREREQKDMTTRGDACGVPGAKNERAEEVLDGADPGTTAKTWAQREIEKSRSPKPAEGAEEKRGQKTEEQKPGENKLEPLGTSRCMQVNEEWNDRAGARD